MVLALLIFLALLIVLAEDAVLFLFIIAAILILSEGC